MNDLTTINNMIVVDYTEALIEFNNERLIEFANTVTSKYQNLIVTDDILVDISKEIAGLNNIVRSIDTRRKEIKKEFNQPYDEFELKIKDVTKIFAETIEKLKKQTQIFEDNRREEVKILIDNIIKELCIVHNLSNKYHSQIQILERYFNKTCREKDIRNDIERQVLLLKQGQELEELKLKQIQEEQTRKEEEIKKEITRRHDFIMNLNKIYNRDFTMEELEKYNDMELVKFYADAKGTDQVDQDQVNHKVDHGEVDHEVDHGEVNHKVDHGEVDHEVDHGEVRGRSWRHGEVITYKIIITQASLLEAERIKLGIQKSLPHLNINIIKEN